MMIVTARASSPLRPLAYPSAAADRISPAADVGENGVTDQAGENYCYPGF
jgi:hypothetical protein